MTASKGAIPRLCAGDRLTRQEFEHRFAAMPDCKKAELVEGVVYMPSPVSIVRHGAPHALLVTWLSTYAIRTPEVQVADNATVRLDLDNEPQPDVLMRIPPERGGRSRVGDDGYVEGPPELVAEIAASNASYDLHDKFGAYRRSGVGEYLVWRVDDRALDWFVLRGSRFELLPMPGDGVLRSEIFPGLWLEVPALLSGDGAAVLARLEQGLSSPEHARWRDRLAARR